MLIGELGLKLIAVFDHLFLLRPILFVPLWALTLAGYYWAGAEGGTYRFAWLPRGRLLLSLLVYSLLMGSVYILNQITDRDTDRLNKKLYLLGEGYVSLQAAWIEAFLLVLAALSLSLLLAPAYRLFLLLSLGLGILYSAPLFKFKGRPFLDILSNGLGYGCLAFMTGWLTQGEYRGEHLLKSLPYVLAVAAVFINTTVPDIAGDKKTGNITTGVFLGIRGTTLLALLAILGAVVASVLFGDWLCLIASGVATPLFAWAAIRGRVKPAMVAYQLGGGMLVLILCVLFPWFLALLLLTFATLWVYHKLRFGLSYPALADRG
jgi:4-hydroxybenzoate polyprenyltransferase